MSNSARASILPFGYRIPCRCESALHLTFLVRDLHLARLCLSSHILFGIEYIAGKSGHAVDRLDRPPVAFEDLFAFRTRKGEARAFPLGNAEGRGVVARESWCWKTSARSECLACLYVSLTFGDVVDFAAGAAA